jgi:hypothetical protein
MNVIEMAKLPWRHRLCPAMSQVGNSRGLKQQGKLKSVVFCGVKILRRVEEG